MNGLLFILMSSVGGLLLSLTGLSIGWLIGTLVTAAFLSFKPLPFLKFTHGSRGISSYWLRAGQCIVGIELGKKMNLSVLHTFQANWLMISMMLVLSLAFSLLAGFVLWKFSKIEMMTSFFSTAPGGLTAIPSIAEEVGANTAVVSIVQTMRVFLVVLTIPLAVSLMSSTESREAVLISGSAEGFGFGSFMGTLIFIIVGCIGYFVGKYLRFPAPWLVGSMVTVAVFQGVTASIIGYEPRAWWPGEFIIIAQVLIGACIGSRLHRDMFRGLGKAMMVALFNIIGLIVAMLLSAALFAEMTGMSYITVALAMAPGGIAEMATTAVVLQADSTFVVAVQVLRVIAVLIVLPIFFRVLARKSSTRNKEHQFK
ncbi:AbrB family transcriptional regulator [Bacillus tianshenii]|nr:AbrB family transcriptional regulator [Bacillus tianshenii]